jgi:hypothetical protein
MKANRNASGMRGVYLVAAKLSELGFIVSPTLRNAAGADLLVTDQKCQRTFTVQVKTNTSSSSFFLIGKKVLETVSPTHVYVLADVRSAKDGELAAKFYVLPSKILGKLGHHDGNWPHIKFNVIGKYLDDWSPFGLAS